MKRYYAIVPITDLYPLFDGHFYADVSFMVNVETAPYGVVPTPEKSFRTVRFRQPSFQQGNDAYVYIGALGDAIAPPDSSVPDGVAVFKA